MNRVRIARRLLRLAQYVMQKDDFPVVRGWRKTQHMLHQVDYSKSVGGANLSVTFEAGNREGVPSDLWVVVDYDWKEPEGYFRKSAEENWSFSSVDEVEDVLKKAERFAKRFK